jgi:hypothetical protein
MSPKLTVLSDPVPSGRFLLTEMAKSLGRPIIRILRLSPPFARNQTFRGHFVVTWSLVEGLRKLGADFNYNPKRLKDVGEAVIGLVRVKAKVRLRNLAYNVNRFCVLVGTSAPSVRPLRETAW